MRGIMYTLDSLLGSIIIMGALIVLIAAPPQNDPLGPPIHYSQDLLKALSAIKVGAVEHPYVQELIDNGTIEDPNATVLDQIGQFWALNETEAARNLTDALLGSTLPSRYGLRLTINNEELYTLDGGAAVARSAAGRRMITGVAKGEALTGSSGVAYLKRIQGKETAAFAYFGGFIGQGNLTTVLTLPGDINTTNTREIALEGDIDGDFSFEINGAFCGSYTAESDPQYVNLTSCASSLIGGNNTFEIVFSDLGNGSISGGFIRVRYVSTELQETQVYGRKQTYFPGVDGVINLYDSFYVPGSVDNVTLELHYWVDSDVALPLFFDIGNVTVYESNATGEINFTVPDTTLRSVLSTGGLSYDNLSNTTIPVRFGFYEGNNSNSTGNQTDVILVTSRAGPMSVADLIGTTETRMEAAKRLDKDFISIVLNASGNRVGLASYWASAKLDQSLQDDNATLQSEVDGYVVQNPSQAQRALCKAMEDSEAELLTSSRKRVMFLMTDGDTTKCCSGGPCNAAKARQDAIDVACDDFSVDEIQYFTVGFGQEAANDPDVSSMLQQIADCTGGQFASSDNISGLEEIYDEFAAEIAASSIVFSFQRATAAENVESLLYADTYLDINFTPVADPIGQYQIPIVVQTNQFTSCTPTVTIPNGLTVTDAVVTSYSGDFWTKRVTVDGKTVYDASLYAYNFTNLGDPFTVQIPSNLLTPGDHTFSFILGANASVDEACMNNNSLIYEGLLNASTARTTVNPWAEGCNWTIEFEDGNTLSTPVPLSYGGAENCTYNSTTYPGLYNASDTYNVAVAQLLNKLDYDDDGRVFVNLDAEDLEISVSLVEQIPYLWGPSMVRLEVSR